MNVNRPDPPTSYHNLPPFRLLSLLPGIGCRIHKVAADKEDSPHGTCQISNKFSAIVHESSA
jgi:hypothetical protein